MVFFFQWAQLKHAIPTRWKILISNYSDVDEKNMYQNHPIIKGGRILSTDNLSSNEIYSSLISNTINKPTSIILFEKFFESTTLDWSKIYPLPHLVTIDTNLRSFQYKILKNVLFLNKKLYPFGITKTVLCSFCKTLEENPIHIFYDCIHVKSLRKDYRQNF